MVEHVVVIGGGIIGVCTAYYLSQDERFKSGSLSVTIVEANDIASGASGKAGGFLALDWHGTATSSLAELSYALHRQLAQELDGDAVYGYRKLTSLNARARASSGREKPSPNAALADSDLEFRQKPPSRGPAQTQWLEGPTIESIGVVSGEDTTAQVHPELFTRTLFEKARARGVAYVKGRPQSWNTHSNGSKMLNLETPDGKKEIVSDTLVLAAGPWTGRVAKQLLDLDLPISNLPGHSILIRPSEPLSAHAVFASIYGAAGVTGSPELFVRPDGLVYFAGENTGATLPGGTVDVKLDPGAIQKLVKASAIISDSLANGKVEVEQLCYRPITPHGAPLVGALTSGRGTVFVATGHGPWGITLGPGTGKVMAELVLNGAVQSADISQLDPRRHVKVPSL